MEFMMTSEYLDMEWIRMEFMMTSYTTNLTFWQVCHRRTRKNPLSLLFSSFLGTFECRPSLCAN